VEFAGRSVLVDGGQRDSGVRALGDGLVPGMTVEIGCGEPGSDAFTRIPVRFFAYCTVRAIAAALDAAYAWRVLSMS
jgi:hypothetical protein